jgi:hypothetical protein
MPGCVDGDDGTAPIHHGIMGSGLQRRRLLVQTAAVAHEHDRRVLATGLRRPENARDVTDEEVALDNAAR